MELLLGNDFSSLANELPGASDQIAIAQFTAEADGILRAIEMPTGVTANTCTSTVWGVYEDSGGTPGKLLGSYELPGTPRAGSVVYAPLPSIRITAGARYWLAVLPIGGSLHWYYGGESEFLVGQSTAATFTALAETTWESFKLGPVAMRGVGLLTPMTADRLYGQLAPTFFQTDEEQGNAGLGFMSALGAVFDPVVQVVQPVGEKPPFAILFCPEECPTEWLPWVGQCVGIQPSEIETLIASGQEVLARQWLSHPINYNRGKVSAQELAAKATLTGSQTLYFYPRYGGEAFVTKVATLSSQTPNPTATKEAILSQMAAWETLIYETVSGGTLAILEASHAKLSEVEAAHTSVADLELHPEK